MWCMGRKVCFWEVTKGVKNRSESADVFWQSYSQILEKVLKPQFTPYYLNSVQVSASHHKLFGKGGHFWRFRAIFHLFSHITYERRNTWKIDLLYTKERLMRFKFTTSLWEANRPMQMKTTWDGYIHVLLAVVVLSEFVQPSILYGYVVSLLSNIEPDLTLKKPVASL